VDHLVGVYACEATVLMETIRGTSWGDLHRDQPRATTAALDRIHLWCVPWWVAHSPWIARTRLILEETRRGSERQSKNWCVPAYLISCRNK
jgi:hypothetical protein